MLKYILTGLYDRVFTCLCNSSLRLIRHFFLILLRWRIRQILLYYQDSRLADWLPMVSQNRYVDFQFSHKNTTTVLFNYITGKNGQNVSAKKQTSKKESKSI